MKGGRNRRRSECNQHQVSELCSHCKGRMSYTCLNVHISVRACPYVLLGSSEQGMSLWLQEPKEWESHRVREKKKQRRRRRHPDEEKRKRCVPRIMIDQSKGCIQQGLALPAVTSLPNAFARSWWRSRCWTPPTRKHTYIGTLIQHSFTRPSHHPPAELWPEPPAEKAVSSWALKILGFK